MAMERSSLAYLSAAAAAVLWMLLVRPYLVFGNEAASGIVHGVIVGAIVWGGFYWTVRVERKHGERDGAPH